VPASTLIDWLIDSYPWSTRNLTLTSSLMLFIGST